MPELCVIHNMEAPFAELWPQMEQFCNENRFDMHGDEKCEQLAAALAQVAGQSHWNAGSMGHPLHLQVIGIGSNKKKRGGALKLAFALAAAYDKAVPDGTDRNFVELVGHVRRLREMPVLDVPAAALELIQGKTTAPESTAAHGMSSSSTASAAHQQSRTPPPPPSTHRTSLRALPPLPRSSRPPIVDVAAAVNDEEVRRAKDVAEEKRAALVKQWRERSSKRTSSKDLTLQRV